MAEDLNEQPAGKKVKGLKRLKSQPQAPMSDTNKHDKMVFDIVLKVLYNNADVDAMHLENEIFKPSRIKMTVKDAERIREVMVSSGLVSPVIGFGNSGKVGLSTAGYQLMSQYGSYTQYLKSQQSDKGPQTVILPIQIQNEEDEADDKENESTPQKPVPKPPRPVKPPKKK